jgi:hypothetical protein
LSTYLTHFIDFNITAEWHFTVTWEVNLWRSFQVVVKRATWLHSLQER